jgi:ribose transport system substrate-binding protein
MRFLSRAATSAASVALFMALVPTMGCDRGPTKPKVAVITNNAFQFWQFAKHGAEDAGKKFDIDVEVKMPPRGNAEEQVQICEDLLVRGIKGIAISSNDAVNMSEFYRTKVAPRVPFVTMDSDVPDPKVRRAYVGTDNYLAGRAAGELVKKAIPDGGKIVIFVGKLDAINAVERRQGLLDELAGIESKTMKDKTPNDARNLTVGKYVLLDTRTDDVSAKTCQDQAEDLFTKVPDVAAVIGLWEYNPPAMLRAKAKSNAKAAVIGFDENDETLRAIKDGSCVGTIVQDPYKFGYESVKILAALAKNDESVLKDWPGIDAEHRIFIPHRVITKDGVDAFQAECNKLLGK